MQRLLCLVLTHEVLLRTTYDVLSILVAQPNIRGVPTIESPDISATSFLPYNWTVSSLL